MGQLVLKRYVNQRILLLSTNGPIWVQVVEQRGQGMRIGIDAPTEVPVHREELALRMGLIDAAGNLIEPKPKDGGNAA